MALYLEKNQFSLFASKDLKTWEKLSDVQVADTIECPEFFPIAVSGEPKESRWIFYGGNGHYLVGHFDGRAFVRESGPHALQRGNCFYASQTYNNLPVDDGRRVLIPWGQVALPGMPFNQMMGLPVELTLARTAEGLRLFTNPVGGLHALRFKTHKLAAQTVRPGQNLLAGIQAELAEIVTEFSPGEARQVAFKLRGVEVVYDVAGGTLRYLDKQASLQPIDSKIRLHFFVDRASIDIFGNDGALYMPMGNLVPAGERSLELSVGGGPATVHALEVHLLRSAWDAPTAAR